MRKAIADIIRDVMDLEPSYINSDEVPQEIAEEIISVVKHYAIVHVNNVQATFDYSIYDHPYFSQTPSHVLGDDITDLVIDVLETM